jgi:hypothetical protein
MQAHKQILAAILLLTVGCALVLAGWWGSDPIASLDKSNDLRLVSEMLQSSDPYERGDVRRLLYNAYTELKNAETLSRSSLPTPYAELKQQYGHYLEVCGLSMDCAKVSGQIAKIRSEHPSMEYYLDECEILKDDYCPSNRSG